MREINGGDILEVEAGIICHQVNCLGIAGAGLALSMKNKFPQWFEWYQEVCRRLPARRLLGQVDFYDATPHLVIASLFAQKRIGSRRNRTLQTDYDALRDCLRVLAKFSKKKEYPVYLPKRIGCGLGGGQWAIVQDAIWRIIPDAIIIDKGV